MRGNADGEDDEVGGALIETVRGASDEFVFLFVFVLVFIFVFAL